MSASGTVGSRWLRQQGIFLRSLRSALLRLSSFSGLCSTRIAAPVGKEALFLSFLITSDRVKPLFIHWTGLHTYHSGTCYVLGTALRTGEPSLHKRDSVLVLFRAYVLAVDADNI